MMDASGAAMMAATSLLDLRAMPAMRACAYCDDVKQGGAGGGVRMRVRGVWGGRLCLSGRRLGVLQLCTCRYTAVLPFRSSMLSKLKR